MVTRDDLLGLDEAAQELGIGRTKLTELTRSGALPSITIGRRKYIEGDALETYLAERDRDPVAASTPKPAGCSDLLTLEQAAHLLAVARTRVYKLIRMGELAAIKHGRHRFIPRDEIDAYWERQRDQAQKVRLCRAKRTAAARSTSSAGRRDEPRSSSASRPSAA